MTSATITKTTDELVVGDVVVSYGMRLELRSAPDVYPASGERDGLDVYAFDGTILNLEETRERGLVPASWITAGTWRVQGNRLASWYVERPEEDDETPAEELGRLRRALSELNPDSPEHRDTLDRIAELVGERPLTAPQRRALAHMAELHDEAPGAWHRKDRCTLGRNGWRPLVFLAARGLIEARPVAGSFGRAYERRITAKGLAVLGRPVSTGGSPELDFVETA